MSITKRNRHLGGGAEPKNSLFKPLVATSLTLALGVSVAIAQPTNQNVSVAWTENNGYDQTTEQTLTVSGTQSITSTGKGIQIGDDGSGTLTINVGKAGGNQFTLDLSNVGNSQYAFIGNLNITGSGYSGSKYFTAIFGKSMKGDIAINSGGSTLNNPIKFNDGAKLEGNFTAGYEDTKVVFSGNGGGITGKLLKNDSGQLRVDFDSTYGGTLGSLEITNGENTINNLKSIGVSNSSYWTISSTGGTTTINFSNATTNQSSTKTANSTIYGGIKSIGSGSLTLNANSLAITDHLFSQGNAKAYINTSSDLTIDGFVRTFKNHNTTGGNYIVVDGNMTANGFDAYDQNPSDSNNNFHSNLIWIGGKLTLTTNNSLDANYGNGIGSNNQAGRPTNTWGFKTLSAYGGVTNVIIAGEIDFSAYKSASSPTYLFAKETGGQATGQNHLILTDSTKTFNFVSEGNFVADLTVQKGGNGLSLAGTNNIGSQTSRVTIYADNSLSSGTGTTSFNRLQFGENSTNTLYLDNLKTYGHGACGGSQTHNILSFDNTSSSTIDVNSLIAESSGQNYIGKNLITFDSSKTTDSNRDTQKKGVLPNTTYFNSDHDKRFSLISADGIMVEATKANVAKITVNTEFSARSGGQNYINITGDLDVKAGGLSSAGGLPSAGELPLAGTNYIIANNISVVGDINASGGTNKTSALGVTKLAGNISASGGGTNSITTNTFGGSATSIKADNATNTIHSTGAGDFVIAEGIYAIAYTNGSARGNTITIDDGNLTIGAFSSNVTSNYGDSNGSSLHVWNGGNSNTITLEKNGAVLTLGGNITSGGGSSGNTINFNGTSGILKSGSANPISASGTTNINITSLTIQDNASGTGTLTTTDGTTNLTFKDGVNGSLNGNITTTGGTTNLVVKDNQSYSITGTLSTENGGKNIIDLSSKSVIINTDLDFSGTGTISSGAGNIIDIGASQTLTLSDGGSTPTAKTINTSGGVTTLNFNGVSAGLNGNVSTNGSTATTTIAIANNSSGSVSGAVTTTDGTTTIKFANGTDAKSLTLGGSGNTITNIAFGDSDSTHNTLALANGTTTINGIGGVSVGANQALTFDFSNTTELAMTNNFGNTGGNAIFNVKDGATSAISGNITTTSGTTNINFASGENAKSLTLNGSGNTLTNITFGDSDSTQNTINLNNGKTTFSGAVSVGASSTTQALAFSLSDNTELALTTGLTTGSNGVTTLSVVADATNGAILSGGNVGLTNLNMALGTLNASTLTFKNTNTTIKTLTSSASDSIVNKLVMGESSTSVSVGNTASGTKFNLEFNDDSTNGAKTFTLEGGTNTIKQLTVTDTGANTLAISGGSTTINEAINLTGKDFTLALSSDNTTPSNTLVTLDSAISGAKATFAGGVADQVHFSELLLKGSGTNELSSVTTSASNAKITLESISSAKISSFAFSGNGSMLLGFTGTEDSTLTLTNSVTVGDGQTLGISIGGSGTRALKVDGTITFEEGSTLIVDFQKTQSSTDIITATLGAEDQTFTIGANSNSIINLRGGAGTSTLNGSIELADGTNTINFFGTATMGNIITYTSGSNNIRVYDADTQENAITGTMVVSSMGAVSNTIDLGAYATLNLLSSVGGTAGSGEIKTTATNILNFNGANATLQGGFGADTGGTSTINVKNTGATITGNVTDANVDFSVNNSSLALNGSDNRISTLALTGTATNSILDLTKSTSTRIASAISLQETQALTLKMTDTTLTLADGSSKITTLEVIGGDDNNAVSILSGGGVNLTTLNLGSGSNVSLTLKNSETIINALNASGTTSNVLALDASEKAVSATINNINASNLEIQLKGTSTANTATLNIGNGSHSFGILALANNSQNNILTNNGSLTISDFNSEGNTSLNINGNGITTINTAIDSTALSNGTLKLTLSSGSLVAKEGMDNVDSTINLALGANSKLYLEKSSTINSLNTTEGAVIDITRMGINAKARDTRNELVIGNNGGSYKGDALFIIDTENGRADTIVFEQVEKKDDGEKSSASIAIRVTPDEIRGKHNALVAQVKDSGCNNDGSTDNMHIIGEKELVGGTVVTPTFSPELAGENLVNYYLISYVDDGAPIQYQEVASSALTVNYDLFLANFNSLNKRMGELRNSEDSNGVWARVFGGAMSNDFGAGSKTEYVTAQAGYDYSLSVGDNARNFIGIALAYGTSDTKGNSLSMNGLVGAGNSISLDKVNSNMVEVGIYNSYVADSGWYNDTIFKFDYIMSEFSLSNDPSTMSSTSNFAMVLSDEFGYRYKFAENEKGSWYIDPQLELAFGYFNQSDFNRVMYDAIGTSTTMQATQDSILTLRTRVGASLGKKFNTEKGFASVYVGAFYEYDYINGGNASVQGSIGGTTTSLDSIESNGRAMLNIGSNIELTKGARLYIDVEKSFGDKQRTFMQFNLGARYSF